MLLQFLPKNIYPYIYRSKSIPLSSVIAAPFWTPELLLAVLGTTVLGLITDRSSGVQKVAVITDATTSSLSIYTQPQLLHPASASTSSLSLYTQTLHSLYTQPQLPHPASAYTPRPFTASTPSLSFYIRTQPLHPASASISSLNLYIQLRLLHIDPSQPLYTVRKINWLRYCLAIFDQFPQFH